MRYGVYRGPFGQNDPIGQDGYLAMQNIKEIAAQLAPVFDRYPDFEAVYMFGSYAEGRAGPLLQSI